MTNDEYSNMYNGLISKDPNAWEMFANKFYPLIIGKITKKASYLNAEDTAQEVYYQLINNDFRALKKIVGGYPTFYSFLNSVIDNVIKSQIERYYQTNNRVDFSETLDNHADERYTIEIWFDKVEEETELRDRINQLDLKYLEVIRLKAQGYKAREIAQILGIPQNTVLTRIDRGKEKLKELLGLEYL
jgi:RNA polymerase sigma factor (sigma-70 family)